MEFVELLRGTFLPKHAESIRCVEDLPLAVVVVLINGEQNILSVLKLLLAQLERTVLPKFII